MQQINVAVRAPMFLVVFVGMAVLGAVAVVTGVLRWPDADGICLSVAGTLYILGTFLVTVCGIVLLNNSLAVLDPGADGVGARWRDYVRRWTLLNHVRATSALLAMVIFSLALMR